MNSNNTYSAFIEHSFRRLSLLIHQQDALNTSSSISVNNMAQQPSNISPLVKAKKNNLLNNDRLSYSSNSQTLQPSVDDKAPDSIEVKPKAKPELKTHRTFMRPPKTQATTSHLCSFSQSPDPSEGSFNYSLNSSHSPSITQQESKDLPIYVHHERGLYDIRCEKDRRNDLREKYNIPPPFQRKWLRVPRYIPQERPNLGQVQKSDSQ